MRRRYRNPAQRLRTTVERLPERTRRAMLDGIERNRIIVGAYTDPRSGGICPMLAAHRNGGRTDLASFALAWDAFTDARRPRVATRREIRTLRSFLEHSLDEDATYAAGSIAQAAARIRTERAELAKRDRAAAAPSRKPIDATVDPNAIRIRRLPWSRTKRGKDIVAAAEEQLAERRAPRPGDREPSPA